MKVGLIKEWLLCGVLACGVAQVSYALPPAITAFVKKPQQQFLPVNEAFGIQDTVADGVLTLTMRVSPEHYLYKDKLKLQLQDGQTLNIANFSRSPTTVDDPEFGQVAVFEQDVVATVPLQGASGQATLVWQGCAKAGLCYPPQRYAIDLGDAAPQKIAPSQPTETAKTSQPPRTNIDPKPTIAEVSPDPTAKVATPTLQTDDTNPAVSSVAVTPPVPVQPTFATTSDTLNHTLAATDPFGVADHPLLSALLLFLAGLVLALTPCIYPMIPIVASIVASGKPTARRGFMLTASYGLGVATSYGLLGVLVAWFGRELGILPWLQNPYILIGFALLFVVLALQMMGLLNLRLPLALSNKLQQGAGRADRFFGSVHGSFIAGALSALVVSPCVSAPLAGALGAVAVSGHLGFGFLALFCLGLGLSLPLVAVGTTQGRFMPKAGEWMVAVKHLGGLLLLAVAVLLVNRVIFSNVMLLVWAAWFIAVAVFFWRLVKVWARAVAVLFGVWAGCLVVGFAMGATNPWQPLHVAAPAADTVKITRLDELDQILKTTPQVLVDVTADWCIECKIMDANLFQNPPTELGRWKVVKLDISDSTDEAQAVLARYQLFGPPALLYYQDGQLVAKQLGEVSRSDFVAQLSQLH